METPGPGFCLALQAFAWAQREKGNAMKTLYYFRDSENNFNLHKPVWPPCFCD